MPSETCLVCFEQCGGDDTTNDDDDCMQRSRTLRCCGCTLHSACYYNLGIHHNNACPRCRTPINEFSSTSENVYKTTVALANISPLRQKLLEVHCLLASIEDGDRVASLIQAERQREGGQHFALERDVIMRMCYLYFLGDT